MLSSILRLLGLSLSGLILVIALSPTLQRYLYQYGFIPDQYYYGDLYNLTHLPAFKELNFYEQDSLTTADKPTRRFQDVDLYLLGDSFTNIDTTFYAGFRNRYVWVGNHPPMSVQLNKQRKNILVIEMIERVLQERLYEPDYRKMYIDGGFISANYVPVPASQEKTPHWIFQRFNTEINQRIEFILFTGLLSRWCKEVKAELQLTAFGRVSQAVISADHQHLFYQPEADTLFPTNAFRPIAEENIRTVVKNINSIRSHYRCMGFDEIYFCFIPNKVTILNPEYGHYNHQIERIESHPSLEAPVISIIDTMRLHPDWYHPGDGHWNKFGKRLWLNKVNQLVEHWARVGVVKTP